MTQCILSTQAPERAGTPLAARLLCEAGYNDLALPAGPKVMIILAGLRSATLL